VNKIYLVFLCIILLSCRSSSEKAYNVSLKYPVILVHGIVAHDRSDNYTFWGRIPSTLEAVGIRVFYGKTDAWGVYESNAEILKNTVDAVLAETNCEKVNIIAHSKGGLDSRYFIWKYDYGDKVASLTTISTPHRGAEIADYLWEHPMIQTDLTIKLLEIFGVLYGDTNPDLYNIIYGLTTVNMEKFNENVIMNPNVFFQSICTTMRNSINDPLLSLSYRYIKSVRGDNDGTVSEYSASWGDKIIKIHGGLSHIDIIDVRMRDVSGINIPNIYVEIVKDLYEKGF